MYFSSCYIDFSKLMHGFLYMSWVCCAFGNVFDVADRFFGQTVLQQVPDASLPQRDPQHASLREELQTHLIKTINNPIKPICLNFVCLQNLPWPPQSLLVARVLKWKAQDLGDSSLSRESLNVRYSELFSCCFFY